ncbi:MAG: DUF354 domain-containing protein [Nitrososphaerota archaeon]|nr:DUF354 domain-containing protein [Nitrososphaerota archaeon]
MKIWFDVLTPKHYLMFASLERLLGKGNDIFLTTREYEELERVKARIKVKATDNVVGRHGGGRKEEKLIESTKRAYELSRLIPGQRPQLTVSFGSPEAARVSFGLGIPHALVCDSPHSFFVGRLTVPLSDAVIYPWVIPSKSWKQYGPGKLVKYHSLDPTAWIMHREMWPQKNSIEKAAEGAVVIREEEYMSSYVHSNGALDFAVELSRMLPDHRVILLRRYFKGSEVHGNLTVYGGEFFGPNVLEKAVAFVGRGGTMNAEAALLGVKSFTMYPGELTYIDRYLIKIGALSKPSGINELASGILHDKKTAKLRLHDASEAVSAVLRKIYSVN